MFLLRKAISLFLVASCGAALAAAPPAPSDGPDLVVLAQPAPSDALDARVGDVALAYDVLEVFQGEPPGAMIVVRHRELGDEDRARLREGERVIVLARRDADAPGRFVAPAPLRATPAALAAFRRWSAPEDVRAARSGSDAIPEPAITRATATAPPSPRPAAAAPAIADVERKPAAVTARNPARPTAASLPAPSPRGAHPADGLTPGPGLPPRPGGLLGPPLGERSDLQSPRRGGRRP